ncbi:metal ABC transporter ATP-binding protein [Cellulomonas sp. ATA003]|uniref:metal ABC transporter ATP-binding protein n=1 Tax=Cellulomonas sp. ATA003 TaxID=3073064 RepID=UPI002872AD2C|nr:metal ABC transporter ATP-binding protein [Cellulomonas sp. ATA003]WNB84619.1 metal ABC transporter ATP-binding protein [Cellulomonas sp. ATA003]
MSADDAALDVRGLTVRYGEVLALDDVTVRLATGRVTGLIGLNGSGKSTLMKSVMGIVRPTSGSVSVLGRTPTDARRAGLVGYVPQSEDVDWTFPISVREVVTMGRYGRLGPLRRTRPADVAAVSAALARVDLAALADRQVGELSGGQRKRVFVARCLAQEAPVLLLDEPFAGVDRRSEAGITTLLRDLVTEGRSVLVSTHDLGALPALADDVVLLGTRVLATGRPDDVLAPQHLARVMGLEPPAVAR